MGIDKTPGAVAESQGGSRHPSVEQEEGSTKPATWSSHESAMEAWDQSLDTQFNARIEETGKSPSDAKIKTQYNVGCQAHAVAMTNIAKIGNIEHIGRIDKVIIGSEGASSLFTESQSRKRKRTETEELVLESQLRTEKSVLIETQKRQATEEKMMSKVEHKLHGTDTQGILDWLSTVDHRPNHEQALQKSAEGTGEWFIAGDQFQKLLRGDQEFLWIHGIPGAGKTILVSTAISAIKQHIQISSLQNNEIYGLAYFYCNFQDARTLNPLEIFGSLVRQLTANILEQEQIANLENVLPKCVTTLYARHNSKTALPSKPTISEYIQCLRDLSNFSAFKRSYIVVDGLDECAKSDHKPLSCALLSLLQTACPASKKLHLLVASRKEPDISAVYDSQPTVRIQNEQVSPDISLYVRAEVEKSRLKQLPDEFKENLIQILVKRADGMFRWVFCQVATLSQLLTIEEIEEELQRLPDGLDETYERILLKIPPRYQEWVRRTLLWLIGCKKPLTPEELLEAIAIDANEGRVRRIFHQDPNELANLCGPLITFVKKGEIQCMTVKLAHYSVQEYLQSDRILHSQASKFAFTQASLEELARCTMAYVKSFAQDPCCMEDLTNFVDRQLCCECEGDDCVISKTEGDKFQCIAKPYKLAHHIGWSWSKYAVALNTCGEYFEMFFGSEKQEKLYYTLCVLMWHYNHFPKNDMESHKFIAAAAETPIAFLIVFAPADLLTAYLAQNTRIPARQFSYVLQDLAMSTPSFNSQSLDVLAAWYLKSGCDLDSAVCTAFIALFFAPMGNEFTIADDQCMELFLKYRSILVIHGGDVNEELWTPAHGLLGAPLIQACEASEFEVVRSLLDLGVDVNCDGNILYGSPLATACSYFGSSLDIVKLLIEHGADVNNPGQGYHILSTPLQAAISDCEYSIAELLIEYGADVNLFTKGGDYQSVLLVAVDEKNIDGVEFLLRHGADINATFDDEQSESCGSALAYACRRKSSGMVKLLIERGAEVNLFIPGGRYPCALAASLMKLDPQESLKEYQEQYDVIHILLENGARVNALLELYRPHNKPYSLQYTYSSALEAVLNYKELFQPRNEINFGIEMVKLLLKHGADLSLCPLRSPFSSLLEVAYSNYQDPHLVKLLLEHDAGAEPEILEKCLALAGTA